MMTPLREPARQSQGVLIDWRTREATYDGVTVRFSTAELRMFEALLQKGGGLLATEELLEVVWGDRQPRSPGLVSVYIWALRGKLARLSRLFSIETRPGSGYRLTIGATGPRKRKASGPRKGPTRKSA